MNITEENLKAMQQLFPEAFEEGKIDFDVLRQLLGDFVDDEQERYSFKWNGKGRALRLSQTPSMGTLRPCKEESKDWDNTENLYIEGDNLEVLKLLQKSYYGKVKMIYIDPPYNTGGDFVYKDNFHDNIQNYKEITGQVDGEGNKIDTNTESNGRFHTDWLNMMYPRLRLARNLLTDDGVIFVQIDDNEVETLGKILNEIFGEDNFVNLLTVKTKIGGVSGSSEGKSLRDSTEYIWIFSKNKSCLLLNPVYIKTELSTRIKNYKDEGRSWKYTSVLSKLTGRTLIKEDVEKGMRFYGYKEVETESITAYAKRNNITEDEVYNSCADKIFRTTNAQSSVRQTVIKETLGLDYEMYGCEYIPIKGRNQGKTIEILYKSAADNQRNMVMFLSDVVEKVDGVFYYLDKVTSLWDDIEYNNLTKEGDVEFSNGKKPLKLLQRIIALSTDKDSLCMDFFSGSGSIAHAIMKQNLEDEGSRKCILIQLPENLDMSLKYTTSVETKKSIKTSINFLDEIGKPHSLCEIGKERIRRAGEKIKAEAGDKAADLDIGFKVFKLDSSNLRKWNPQPDDLVMTLQQATDNFLPDRTEQDVLYEIILKMGLELTCQIEEEQAAGETVYIIGGGALMICLGENITTAVAEAVVKLHEEYESELWQVVFRDTGFASDMDKTNVKETLKAAGLDEDSFVCV